MIPSLADLNHIQQWVSLMTVIVVALWALAEGIGTVIDRARKSLEEPTPEVDDITERRRVNAEKFAERRRQLQAAAVGKRL